MMGNGWGIAWMWFLWPLAVLGALMALLARGSGGASNRGDGSAPAPGQEVAGRQPESSAASDTRAASSPTTNTSTHLRQLHGENDQ